MGPCSDEELVAHIRRLLAASLFHGEGYRKIWAKLRFEGIRTSRERVRLLMQKHGLQAYHRVGHPHGPKAHDGTIITETPDEMWGTDATTTITVEEGTAFVFIGVDHCTFECTGLHASKKGDRFEALEPIHQGVREHFIGNVRHARILKHHQAGQIVLKMAKFTLIVEQIEECFGMESHYRSRGHDGQDHYPPSYPGAIEVGKSDPILYHSGAEGKSQHSR